MQRSPQIWHNMEVLTLWKNLYGPFLWIELNCFRLYSSYKEGQFTYELSLKVPCWLNLLDTGGKYCKRYTLLESKEVKTRNGKFELVVEKFISFDYLLNAFLREVFLVHRKSLSILIEVMIVQLYSTLQLPSYTH